MDTVKKFWKTFKPLFSEKEVPGFDKLILVENETIILINKDIAECMNSYFSHNIYIRYQKVANAK